MTPFFPKQIASRGIAVYLISLIIVSIVFFDYAMNTSFFILGFICVVGFFLLSATCSKSWKDASSANYQAFIVVVALVLRLIWIIFSYYYYIEVTGIPFEYSTADALGYHNEAVWLAGEDWAVAKNYYFESGLRSISDVGYPLYLTILYKIFGPVIIIPRIIKALLSTLTCVLIYKLSSRTFGEGIGRIAGIMSALMPNFIIYCGYHLKETEMIFLEVAFLERLDYLIRNRKYNFIAILLPTLLAGSLFFFRTVLGAAAVFSFATVVVLSSTPTMGDSLKRVVLIVWGILCLVVLSGGTAITEVEALWEEKDVNLTNKRTEQTSRGNQWAQFATGSVMVPMAFVLPFATMVDVDEQYIQQEKSGGNYIRNFMGFFALLAIYESIRRKKWRGFVLIGSFVAAYLGVVSLSGFSNSERFLLPGLPCLIMMWAYGVSTLREKAYRYLSPWCLIVVIMEVAWAYFKLGSRGLF